MRSRQQLVRAGKRRARAALEAAGYELRRQPQTGGAPDALAKLATSCDCSLVVDVGANEGEFGVALRRFGYQGEILSFEPRLSAFAQLLAVCAADNRWNALPFALGSAKGEISLNVSRNGVSSSVLPMDTLHLEAAPGSDYLTTAPVAQERLDDVVLPRLSSVAIVAMKLDVQGYEAEVLRGAEELLARTAALQLELSLAPVYRGQADWRSLTSELTDLGFVPWAIEPVLTDPRTGQTLQVDLVFTRASLDRSASPG
jgi:FkbM family methyltransferase